MEKPVSLVIQQGPYDIPESQERERTANMWCVGGTAAEDEEWTAEERRTDWLILCCIPKILRAYFNEST